MNKIMKLYYLATLRIPRSLPRNEEECLKLKSILQNVYGIKDSPQTWATVFSHVCGTKPLSIRRPYVHYLNLAKRLDINEAANAQKVIALGQLRAKLEEKIKELAKDGQDATVPEGTFDLQADVPRMSKT